MIIAANPDALYALNRRKFREAYVGGSLSYRRTEVRTIYEALEKAIVWLFTDSEYVKILI